MNPLQRNLWILVTVSALAIILQGTFNRVNITSDISQSYNSCQKIEKKRKKKKCATTYTSYSNRSYVKLERRSTCGHLYSSITYPDVDDFVAVDKLPSATNFATIASNITYPTYAKEKGMEGQVLARILVDENGKYVKHRILKYDNCGMRYHVEKQLPKLQFLPAEKDGQHVAVWVNLPFKFTLN